MQLAKDFLNSILFPTSEKIIEISSFDSKELLSKYSNIEYNRGTRKVNDTFIAKIRDKDNPIIIDLEMEKNFSFLLTEKFFGNGNGLRIDNRIMETWVIALCLDNSKNPGRDKGSQSPFFRKYNANDESEKLNYIHIYEIYLNDLYINLNNNISILEKGNEAIREEGKEWIKLLTITLWSKYYRSKSTYILPSLLSFKGKNISKAIYKIANIQDLDKIRIETEIRAQIENEKKDQEYIEKRYMEGYQKGQIEGYNYGYDKGQNDGYQKGVAYGYQIGVMNFQLKMLDFFFVKFLNGKSLENIEILGQISFALIKNRYTNYNNAQSFIDYLSSKNLLIA